MNLRHVVAVGSLFAVASGCAYLPEGFPSRTSSYESPGRLFVKDSDADSIPVAEPKVATAPEGPGLKIRKSKRGNMESYVVRGQRYFTLDSAEGYSAKGVASWYGPNFHGRTASNGEVYDMYRLTAAHKTLPLPTYAKVTHVENGRSVVVKINDRGPFSGDRIIDLSFAAALRLGMINDGTSEVEVQALSPEEMMVLSGPDNTLEVDFYNSEDEQQEVAEVAVDQEPAEEELLSVAAVELDQSPITAQPINELDDTPAAGDQVISLENTPVASNGTDPAGITPGAPATSDDTVAFDVAVADTAAIKTTAETVQASEELLSDDELAAAKVRKFQAEQAQLGQAQADVAQASQAQTNTLDSDLKDTLLPGVADANVQGLAAVPAAVQTVPGPDEESRDTYFIQAGVYANVADAELVAVDVVLAAPDELVHIKPLKDSHMYRITVGPVVSSERASEVSGLLTDAGLENFRVRVKQ